MVGLKYPYEFQKKNMSHKGTSAKTPFLSISDLLWIFCGSFSLVYFQQQPSLAVPSRATNQNCPKGQRTHTDAAQPTQLASNDGPHRVQSSAQFLFAKRRDVLQVVLSMAHGGRAERDLVAAV